MLKEPPDSIRECLAELAERLKLTEPTDRQYIWDSYKDAFTAAKGLHVLHIGRLFFHADPKLRALGEKAAIGLIHALKAMDDHLENATLMEGPH